MTRGIRKYQKYLNGGFFADPETPTVTETFGLTGFGNHSTELPTEFSTTETETVTVEPKRNSVFNPYFGQNKTYNTGIPSLETTTEESTEFFTEPSTELSTEPTTEPYLIRSNNNGGLPRGNVFIPPPIVLESTKIGSGYRKSGHGYPKYISGSGRGYGRHYLHGGYVNGVTTSESEEPTTTVTETVTVETPSEATTTEETFTTATDSIPEVVSVNNSSKKNNGKGIVPTSSNFQLPTYNSPLAHNVPPTNMTRAANSLEEQLKQSIQVLKEMVASTQSTLNSGASTNAKKIEGSGRRHYAHGHKPAKQCGNARYYGTSLSFDL